MSAVAVVVVVALALGACALGGNGMSMQRENLENQRKAAAALLHIQGGVEKITFTDDGGHPGLGASWRANAVIVIGGQEHKAILGFDLGSTAFIDPLPHIVPAVDPEPVIVVFSDGSSQVIG